MQEKVLKILEFDKIIFRLLSECASSLGKELAEKLIPFNAFNEVKSAQHETSQAVTLVISNGSPPFGGIHDVRNSLKKISKGAVLNPKELMEIADTLRAGRNLKAYHSGIEARAYNTQNNSPSRAAFSEHHHRYDILDPIFESLYSNKKIEDKIFSCIINEEEIADNASPALYSVRRQITSLEQKAKEQLNNIIHSSSSQKYLQENFVTMRSGRYVLPVKQEFRSEIPGLVHDSSASGATLFVEPMALVEANNAIKQLKIKENNEIERILAELTETVSNIRYEFEESICLLARLDFIFAKARLSLSMDAVHPHINQSGYINLKGAKHPLLNPELVVPIDVRCGDKFNTLVVTGPNTGGKTVTLKTVGLLTLMAQAGLHIPCNNTSEINVFQNVFADIGDEQSIEQNLSTFSSHMVNLVKILHHIDSNSLVLLDELGSGTDPVEGSAIAMSILEHLHNCGTRTIASTHYSELKSFAIKTSGIENASCEFDVNTLRPTYKLLIGVPGKSNAFAISKKLGLDSPIIERAKEFISTEKTQFEDIIAEVEKNRITSQAHLEEIELVKNECQKLKNELLQQREALNNQKNHVLREARQEAKLIIEEAKEEAEKALKEIQKLADENETERNKKGENLKKYLRKKLKETEESLTEPLFDSGNTDKNYSFNMGDSVFIPSLKQKGTVLCAPDENNNVQVQAGIIKLKIPASQLKPANQEKVSLEKASLNKLTSNKTRVVSIELDLRGQTLEEALENTDKYLDNVFLSGLKSVTIIHGKGTGILRKGIHQFLKTHPHVKAFRLGRFGEGEQGVTIVELH